MAAGGAATRKKGAKPPQAESHSRRRRSAATPTTIPELKRSFDSLEQAVGTILKSPDSKGRVRKFQEAWRRIFGRPVDAAAAEAYLKVKSRGAAAGAVAGKTRKAKGQKGGAAAAVLAGAPLDFQTRPGVDGVHGSFLPYLTKGLDFYNTVNQESMFRGCGTVDTTPKVPADLGSNKVGGGLLSDAAFVALTRPFSASSPPSVANDIQTTWQGRQLGASPDPVENRLRFV